MKITLGVIFINLTLPNPFHLCDQMEEGLWDRTMSKERELLGVLEGGQELNPCPVFLLSGETTVAEIDRGRN